MEELAELQVTVARLYLHAGRDEAARELVTEAIARLDRRPGRRLAMALETMAQMEEASGRYAAAAAMREEALAAAAGKAAPRRRHMKIP
jgi:hypothetical protein